MCTYFTVNLLKIVQNQIIIIHNWTACIHSSVHVARLCAFSPEEFFFGGVLGSFLIQSSFLARARTIHLLFPPLYSSVLEPNFNLCFSQIKRGREVMSFGSHHVLLPIKFFFQSLKLFGCENCANSFRLSLLEIPGFVFFMVNN